MSLKTASEMYQYCIDNKFGQGMSKKWGEKHFSLIANSLQKDEEILMCFIGLHNYVSATNHNDYFAYAITNKRFIMAQKKLIGEVLQTVVIGNLNDITSDIGLVFGVVTFDTIKEKFNIGTDKISAKAIQEKAHEILLNLKSQTNKSPAVSSNSVADELLKYKQLLDIGAITQEEFEKVKSDLLFK